MSTHPTELVLRCLAVHPAGGDWPTICTLPADHDGRHSGPVYGLIGGATVQYQPEIWETE